MREKYFSYLNQILNTFQMTCLPIDILNMSYLDHMPEILKAYFIYFNNLHKARKVFTKQIINIFPSENINIGTWYFIPKWYLWDIHYHQLPSIPNEQLIPHLLRKPLIPSNSKQSVRLITLYSWKISEKYISAVSSKY